MASDIPLVIPTGYYPPLAVVTPDDHRAWIIIATSLGLVIALLSAVIRATVRSQFGQRLGVDDAFLAAGIVAALIQEGVVLGATSRGLGRTVDDLSPTDLRMVEKSFYTANILSLVALALCKWSVAWFILRLTPVVSQKRMIYAVCWSVAIWMVLGIFLLALQCDLSHPWVPVRAQCTGVFARHIVVGSIDIALELALLAVVVSLVSDLQTASWNKIVVVIAFAFRLPLIALIGLRLSSFHQPTATLDFSLGNDLYLIYTEAQINYSIISATIPIIRPFINSLSTHYGMGQVGEYSASASAASRASRALDQSLDMSVLKSGVSRKTRRSTRLGSGNTSILRSGISETKEFTYEASSDAYAYSDQKDRDGLAGPVLGKARALGKEWYHGRTDSEENPRLSIRRDVHWVIEAEHRKLSLGRIPTRPSTDRIVDV